ncbi:MAG: hypothetical protein PVS2B2_12510 [Candidatus Acidiferrum sp.]
MLPGSLRPETAHWDAKTRYRSVPQHHPGCRHRRWHAGEEGIPWELGAGYDTGGKKKKKNPHPEKRRERYPPIASLVKNGEVRMAWVKITAYTLPCPVLCSEDWASLRKSGMREEE